MGSKNNRNMIVLGGMANFDGFLSSEDEWDKVILPLCISLPEFLSIREKVRNKPDMNDGAILYPIESPELFHEGWTYMRLSRVDGNKILKRIFRVLAITEEDGNVFLVTETLMPCEAGRPTVKINLDLVKNPARYKNPSLFFIFSGKYCQKVSIQERLDRAIKPWEMNKVVEVPI